MELERWVLKCPPVALKYTGIEYTGTLVLGTNVAWKYTWKLLVVLEHFNAANLC